ncbi:squalene synthase HpnC [Blastopirellula marina]|uniref:Squalene synthase HpnC n=1 Tax=Blastopirellula marina TaxID=124 RepID=A0A2S8GTL3_9BACT|nr:squalene synthase HpnC [Blastopirellula marina]PQO47759.1 squalene synthase HpnC [Blastopirellula marina]
MTPFQYQLANYGPNASWQTPSQSDAYAYCQDLTSATYENFSVISWFLPTELHPHFAAIYAYCRWADDLADHATSDAEGLTLLAWWEEQLESCYQQDAHHPVFVALRRTIREFKIPITPLRNLLIAFRQDQTKKRYATYRELLAYCRNSADPVGRLVLYLGRCYSPEAVVYSDRVSTGLQLANFWQDVRRDFEIGRVYIPAEDFEQFGLSVDDMPNCTETDEFRQLMRYQVRRADQLLAAGEPIIDFFPKNLKVDIALFVRGGQTILQQIKAQQFDTWERRPHVRKRTKFNLLMKAWWEIHVRRKTFGPENYEVPA